MAVDERIMARMWYLFRAWCGELCLYDLGQALALNV